MKSVYRGETRCLDLQARQTIFRADLRLRDAGVPGADAVTMQRHRVSARTLGLVVREGLLENWPRPAPPTLPPGVPVLAVGGQPRASALAVSRQCKESLLGRSYARLRWKPVGTGVQRVVVTIFRAGFETGNFEVSGPVGPRVGSITWYRVHGQAIHRWRVLTRTPRGWVPSVTVAFRGPPCIVSGP
ncbi:MAG: hypothetical protein ABR583_07045 [Gaiellaceae bacterium]